MADQYGPQNMGQLLRLPLSKNDTPPGRIAWLMRHRACSIRRSTRKFPSTAARTPRPDADGNDPSVEAPVPLLPESHDGSAPWRAGLGEWGDRVRALNHLASSIELQYPFPARRSSQRPSTLLDSVGSAIDLARRHIRVGDQSSSLQAMFVDQPSRFTVPGRGQPQGSRCLLHHFTHAAQAARTCRASRRCDQPALARTWSHGTPLGRGWSVAVSCRDSASFIPRAQQMLAIDLRVKLTAAPQTHAESPAQSPLSG